MRYKSNVIGIISQKTYIEVKKHQNNIGRPVVQKLHSIMVAENVRKGCIVTTSDFTQPAIEYSDIGVKNVRRILKMG